MIRAVVLALALAGCGEGGGEAGAAPQDDACARPTCEAVCEGEPVALCECGALRWSEMGGRVVSLSETVGEGREEVGCYPDGAVARRFRDDGAGVLTDAWFTPDGDASTAEIGSAAHCRAWKAEGAPFSCE